MNRKATNRDSSECATRRKAHSERIDLGIALLHDVAIPGVRYSQREIAWWAGCSDMLISNIERKALAKLSRRIAKVPGWGDNGADELSVSESDCLPWYRFADAQRLRGRA